MTFDVSFSDVQFSRGFRPLLLVKHIVCGVLQAILLVGLASFLETYPLL